MNAQTTLNRIMVALGNQEAPGDVVEVKFEQRKMADQEVTFEADSFEAGQEVFVTNEDEERIPAPEGEYQMEDGSYMSVDDKGVIMGYGPKEEEAEQEEEAPKEEAPQEVEASEQVEAANPKRVIQTESVSVETQFAAQIKEVEVKFAAEKAELESKNAELEATKLELSKEIEELKERLSQEPASAPLKHNVEGTATTKEAFYRTQGSKVDTLQSKVYARINK